MEHNTEKTPKNKRKKTKQTKKTKTKPKKNKNKNKKENKQIKQNNKKITTPPQKKKPELDSLPKTHKSNIPMKTISGINNAHHKSSKSTNLKHLPHFHKHSTLYTLKSMDTLYIV